MSKIAFDLDGVFIPDCDRIPFLGGQIAFYELAHFMRPLFLPQGEWDIVTARPARFKTMTEKWVNQHFGNKPQNLWHGAILEDPWVYKAEVINEQKYDIYVESDHNIVMKLRARCPNTTVIHLATFLAGEFA